MRSVAILLGVIGVGLLAHLVSIAPAFAQAAAVKNPVAHCRAVGTQDAPPGWDQAPRWMARSSGISGHNYSLQWRCSAGQVLVCGVQDMHEVGCSKRDRRQRAEVPGYCRENPNSSSIPYAAGNRRSVYEWRCRGTVPVVARRYIAEHQLDVAGYLTSEWKPLASAAPVQTATMIQGLPAPIKNSLDAQFPGWQLFSETDGCDQSYSKAIVAGRFNRDGVMDFAVRLRWKGQGRIVAFISNGQTFHSITLERGSFAEIRNQGLSLARRGERVSVLVNDSGSRTAMILANDAPLGGTCEASAYVYLFQGQNFRRAFLSD